MELGNVQKINYFLLLHALSSPLFLLFDWTADTEFSIVPKKEEVTL